MPEVPKTWSNEAPPSGLRAHWKLATLAVVAAAAITYVAIAVLALKNKEERADTPAAIRNLEDLAGQLTQGKREEVLARVNGRTLLSDAALAVSAAHPSKLTRGEYVGANGLTSSFDVLDADDNGVLSSEDLSPLPGSGEATEKPQPAKVIAAGQEPSGVIRTDKRTGLELSLDQLRSSWLSAVEATDLAAMYVFRGKSLPAADFGSGPFGTLTLKGGSDGVSGEKIRGFMTQDMTRGKVRLLDSTGSVREFNHTLRGDSEVARFDRDPEASESLWYAQVRQLSNRQGYANANAWAELALKLQAAGGMGEEAADAARRALIYDATLSELYPLVDVELRAGQLRRKAH